MKEIFKNEKIDKKKKIEKTNKSKIGTLKKQN